MLEKNDISNFCKLVINGALEQIAERDLYLIQVMKSLCDKLPLFDSFHSVKFYGSRHSARILSAALEKELLFLTRLLLFTCVFLQCLKRKSKDFSSNKTSLNHAHTTLTESKENACNGNSSLGTTKVTRKHPQYRYIAGAASARPYIG